VISTILTGAGTHGTILRMVRVAFGLFLVAASAIASLSPTAASAQERTIRMRELSDLHRACERAEGEGRRTLQIIPFPAGAWRFGAYDPAEGFLPIDTRRNLRAFDGHAELFPARMEQVGFVVGPDRAAELQRRAGQLTLRVAFFLGFDEQSGNRCLIRPAAGVTTVRMDVAFLVLVQTGRMVARQDTDRLRAWLDDAEHDAIPGRGPRGAMSAASLGDRPGVAPEPWQQTIAAENRGATARALGACHAAGVARGAGDGQVVVRIVVDSRSGQVSDPEVELSSIGDDEEAACIAQALLRLQFVPVPALGGRVVLSVPVRLLH